MSETNEEVPAPDDAGSADIALAFDLHVREAPPLSWLSATAALSAMIIGQVLVPALNNHSPREFLFTLGRWGDFATNLAAISGLLALCFGLYAFVRYSAVVGLRQRLLLAAFSGIFLPTIAVATLFERQRTTTQIVLFALGAAYVVGALCNSAAARARGARYPRAIAIVASAMATVTLVAQVLRLMSRARLDIWQLQAFEVLLALGELSYLALLLGAAPLVWPGRFGLRDRLARAAAVFLLPLLLGGLYYAERQLQGEYTLLLYHAQRVNLFIDQWPGLYSVPLAIAGATALAGGLGSDPLRRQGGAALCLLLAAGFSPHAPGRLLSMALALILIARTVIAPVEASALQRATTVD